MSDWIAELGALADAGKSSVLVTVGGIRGSAPRETGAHMLVTARETIGSIGGGQLEYQCTALAAEMLADGKAHCDRRRFSLGANCGQCCGGVVEILFDCLPESRAGWLAALTQAWREQRPAVLATRTTDPAEKLVIVDRIEGIQSPAANRLAGELLESGGDATVVDGWLLESVRRSAFDVALFGAGHVGTAIVDLLSRLDCRVRWIDNRRNIFPQDLPANVVALDSAHPAREVAAVPPGSYCLVMTHSHPLDLDICASLLKRDDIAHCGLIGSVSKRRRFEKLLKKQGVGDAALARLICPIGIPGIDGKQPVEIAFAVVAELLQSCSEQAVTRRREPYLEVTG